jgi:hypothetical protein
LQLSSGAAYSRVRSTGLPGKVSFVKARVNVMGGGVLDCLPFRAKKAHIGKALIVREYNTPVSDVPSIFCWRGKFLV